jgi:hypothetical protein
MNITSVRDSDWKKDDGTTVRVTTLRFEDGTEAPGYDLPSVPEVGKPLPEGWVIATSKAGKPYVKVPKEKKGGFGGTPAYRNTKEGQAFEQQQMNRRTALMQAVEWLPLSDAGNVPGLLTCADYFSEWLQSSPVLGRAAAAPAVPSAGDSSSEAGRGMVPQQPDPAVIAAAHTAPDTQSAVSTGGVAADEGGPGGSDSVPFGEGGTKSNPGPSSPDHSNDHVHQWANSPKLSKYEVCTAENCMETRRKDSRA